MLHVHVQNVCNFHTVELGTHYVLGLSTHEHVYDEHKCLQNVPTWSINWTQENSTSSTVVKNIQSSQPGDELLYNKCTKTIFESTKIGQLLVRIYLHHIALNHTSLYLYFMYVAHCSFVMTRAGMAYQHLLHLQAYFSNRSGINLSILLLSLHKPGWFHSLLDCS